jgi:hypothetical protein
MLTHLGESTMFSFCDIRREQTFFSVYIYMPINPTVGLPGLLPSGKDITHSKVAIPVLVWIWRVGNSLLLCKGS